MPPAIPLTTNQKFGSLTVIERVGVDRWGQVLWQCKCECGNLKTVRSADLRDGRQVSCGCQKAERIRRRCTTHGQTNTKKYERLKSELRRYRRYNLTEDDYKDLLVTQDFRCAICGVDPNNPDSGLQRGFHIDHDHVTGKVRGLLCGRCNVGIGLLGDSEENLEAAIKYLRRASALVALPGVSE
ncbi:MAG: endonuclease VII domain-containing protein [Candidatus Altimarinota bacterium]